MNKVITYAIVFGTIIGGIDYIMGNKKGYGEKFQEGFMLLGPTALSMVGIICLSNMIADLMRILCGPLLYYLHMDLSVLAGFFAIDMGGYQLANQLTSNVTIGLYHGIVTCATFGCTFVFTIPVGIGLIEKEDHVFFTKGIMIGLACLPVTLVVGGICCHLNILVVLYQSMILLIVSLLCGLGLWKFPSEMISGFQVYVILIKSILTIGLIAGAVVYLLRIERFTNLIPVGNAMAVVSSIGIVLLGSLPLALFIQRVFQKPICSLGNLLGLDTVSMTGIIVGLVSPLPAINLLHQMSSKGKVANIAFLVSATSVFGAHLGFVVSQQRSMITTLVLSKILGGICALIVALAFPVKTDKIADIH